MKFLHSADWQLGREFSFAGEGDGHDPSAALADARFEAVKRIAGLAASEAVDAVLVAGDVFDRPALSDHALRRALDAMRGFSGRWVLLPGNHDAALAESVWTRLERLGIVGDNVRLALEPGALEFPEAGFAVLVAPLRQIHTHDDLSAAFDSLDTAPGLIRIGLAHGSVAGILPAEIDSPNPIAADRAARARLDYLALGDWHGTRRIDARTWYSGTPEPERFRGNEPGNVLLVEIERPGALPRVEVRPIARFRWRREAVHLDGPAEVDALAARLRDFDPASVLQLDIEGSLDLAAHASLRSVLAAARARLQVLQTDERQLRLAPSSADLASLRLDGAAAAVAAELAARQGDPQQAELAGEALRILARLARELPEAG